MTSTDQIISEPTKKTAGASKLTPPHPKCGNSNSASGIALSFEFDEEFQRLHADLKREFKPDDRQEEETVFAIAKNCWLKHRLTQAQRMPFLRKALALEPKARPQKPRENYPRN
jgi:hypothetical protein